MGVDLQKYRKRTKKLYFWKIKAPGVKLPTEERGFSSKNCSKVVFLKNNDPRREAAKGGEGFGLCGKIMVFMKYGPIEVTVSPFELKLGLFEAKSVEKTIYTTFDAISSHI